MLVDQSAKKVGNVVSARISACVEPCLDMHRRDVGGLINVVAKRKIIALGECSELLCVPALHHPEAAEFPFDSVEEAVMVRVAGNEPIAADPVEGLHALDDLDREREAGDPRLPCGFV